MDKEPLSQLLVLWTNFELIVLASWGRFFCGGEELKEGGQSERTDMQEWAIFCFVLLATLVTGFRKCISLLQLSCVACDGCRKGRQRTLPEHKVHVILRILQFKRVFKRSYVKNSSYLWSMDKSGNRFHQPSNNPLTIYIPFVFLLHSSISIVLMNFNYHGMINANLSPQRMRKSIHTSYQPIHIPFNFCFDFFCVQELEPS